MSQQIQISGGAKVRNLQDVIIGTSGVLTSLGFDVANGVPRLDVNGKILVSQLPNSVMEYKGTWNAATNTPTLVNGTGNQGDVYLCNVAGTVDFGAGPIAFVVGDQVIYSGSIWQRASGATGTVTSVAITESGDSLNITGSPITTSGTINIGFNGTNLQYVNGAGNLTTFPTLITSIGLSMPSAFSVANSPLTANGTIAVTGAGVASQYIRGDGSLATFPTIATEAQRLITEVYNETGATLTKGTVVYINGGHGNLPTITKAIATGDATSAQTYGIVQTDITNNNNGYVVVIGSLTDLDTSAYVEGTQLYLSSTTAGAWTSVKQYAPAHLVYVAIVTRSHPTQGVVEVMIQNGFEMDELHNVSAQSPLNNQGLFYNTSTSLWENKSIATALGYTPADDSLVVKLAGTQTITGVKNFSGYTTFTSTVDITSGLTFSNSGFTLLLQPPTLSVNRTVTFADITGTIAMLEGTQTFTGTKTFNANPSINTGGQSSLSILSSTGNSALIFGYVNNILKGTIDISATEFKFASAINSTFKFQASGLGIASLIFDNTTNYSYTFPAASGTIALVGGSGVGTVTSVAALTIGTSGTDLSSTVANSTTTPVITLNVPTASATNRGALSSADWTTFNNKQNALTNPVTGTGTTNYLPKFTGASTIGNSLVSESGGVITLGTGQINLGGSGSTIYMFPAFSANLNLLQSYNPTTSVYTTEEHRASDYSFKIGTTTGLILNASGNLGLGVTPSAWADFKVLEFPNGVYVGTYTGGGQTMYLGANNFFNGTDYIYKVSGYATRYQQASGAHQWFISTVSGTAGNVASFTQAMTLTAAGNLGIGTSSPSALLHLSQSTTNLNLYLQNTSGSGKTWAVNSDSLGSFNIHDTTVNRLTITSGGNVGIGTSSPKTLLDVYADTDIWHTFIGGATSKLLIGGQAGAGGVVLQAGNASTANNAAPTTFYKLMLQRDGGNVLIGTTTDSGQKLQVNGTILAGGSIKIPSTSYFIGNATYGYRFNNGADSVNLLVLTDSGNATFTGSVTATSFFESSDSRLKTLIQDNYQTKGIASITPKLYTKNGKVELGYYAQDFVGILDSAVSKGSDDMLSLSYREVLVAKVYALEQRIKELENK